jgi:hypothetical protein
MKILLGRALHTAHFDNQTTHRLEAGTARRLKFGTSMVLAMIEPAGRARL